MSPDIFCKAKETHHMKLLYS